MGILDLTFMLFLSTSKVTCNLRTFSVCGNAETEWFIPHPQIKGESMYSVYSVFYLCNSVASN